MALSSAVFISWLLEYRYLAIFPLTIIEGPIITILIGFFISLGVFNPLIAYIIIVVGDLTGDILYYAAGRWGGRKFIDRWGKYFSVGPGQIETLKKQFDKRGDKLLFVGKMSHGIGGAFLVAAGFIKMPFNKFIFANMLATLVKSAVLLLIGFYFGQSLVHIKSLLDALAFGLAAVFTLFIIIYFFYLRGHRRNS